MIYFTLKMFHEKSVVRERALWTKLVDVFRDKETTHDDAEKETENKEEKQIEPDDGSQFITVSWDPYINFFLSLFFFLFSVGIGEKVVPNSILFCGISVLFAALCFIALADNTDHFAFIAILANSLSW